MLISEKIEQDSDSLIALLSAQCIDLENLLNLAREETVAVKHGNFGKIMDIVSERDKIGKRLEIFQQQISELRVGLEKTGHKNITTKIIETTNLTLAQDRETKLLLEGKKEETALEMRNLGKYEKGMNAYMKERKKGLTYSRTI